MGRGMIALLLAGCVAEAAPPVRHPAGQGGSAAAVAGITWTTLDLTGGALSDPNSVLTGAITDAGGGFYDVPYNAAAAYDGYDEGATIAWSDFESWFGASHTAWTSTDGALIRITLQGSSDDLVQLAVAGGIKGTTKGRAMGIGGTTAGTYRIFQCAGTASSWSVTAARSTSTGDVVTLVALHRNEPVVGEYYTGSIVSSAATLSVSNAGSAFAADGTPVPIVTFASSAATGGARTATVKVEVALLDGSP